MILKSLDGPFSRLGSMVPLGYQLVRQVDGREVVLEVPGDFIVQSDILGSETVFGQDGITLKEPSDELLRFAGFDRGCMDIVG